VPPAALVVQVQLLAAVALLRLFASGPLHKQLQCCEQKAAYASQPVG
jgi:hypothetical protein